MDEETKDIIANLQLENICKLYGGEYRRTNCWATDGLKLKRIIIEYPANETD